MKAAILAGSVKPFVKHKRLSLIAWYGEPRISPIVCVAILGFESHHRVDRISP